MHMLGLPHRAGVVAAQGSGPPLRLAGGCSGTDFPDAVEVAARDAEGGSVVWLHDYGGCGEAAAEQLGETLPPQLVLYFLPAELFRFGDSSTPPPALQHRNASPPNRF